MSLVVETPDPASARAFDAFAARFLGVWHGVGHDVRTGAQLRHWLRWTVATPGEAVLVSEGTLEPGAQFTDDIVCPWLGGDWSGLLRQAIFCGWYDWMYTPPDVSGEMVWATRAEPIGLVQFRETIEPLGDDIFVSTWEQCPPGQQWHTACVLSYQRVGP